MGLTTTHSPATTQTAKPRVISSTKPANAFDALVQDINKILGPSSGINSEDVDVENIKNRLVNYQSNEKEWAPYAFADTSRAYTRNLVDAGNGKSNLLILVWTPGKASPIHDHADAHCVMKILKGSLTETLYEWPCQGNSSAAGEGPSGVGETKCPSTKHTCSHDGGLEPHELGVNRKTTYDEGGVTYMSDQLGLHRIANTSDSEVAVSLHLYTPPNAARHGCHIFDQSTGKKSHVNQSNFYSEFGVKLG
ncbi:hypothetical protein MBLNU230_g0196t1 [Neophaeotheca triangularis]